MSRTIAIASLALLLEPLAHAGQMTLADLQQICAASEVENQNACRFYVLGVVEGAGLTKGVQTAAGPLCIAPNVQSTTLMAAVKKLMQADLRAFPRDKSLAASGFVVAAAMKAFPCKP